MPRKKRKAAPRPYAQGQIYQRGSKWYVYWKGQRHATGSDDRLVAEEFLLSLKRGTAALKDKDAYDVSQLLDDFMGRVTLAPGTKATYESQIRSHLKPFFGRVPVRKVDTDLLSDYREMRTRQLAKMPKGCIKRRSIKQTSINRELAVLRAAMNDLRKRRPNILAVLPYFPMESEKDNVRKGFLRELEFRERLYPELPRHLRPLAVCAFYGGGRMSEWLTLVWKNVDFDGWMAYFPKTKNHDARTVPIFEGLMREAILEAKHLRDNDYPGTERVFLYQGKPFSRFNRAWRKACKRAALPDLLFHDMRRSAEKHMSTKGVPQRIRMQIQGHKTDSMSRRYNIPDAEDMEYARKKMRA